MIKPLFGVYEHGVIRPLTKLPLAEHQRIEIRLEIPRTAVQMTRAIIRVKHKVGKMLAQSAVFSSLGS